MILWPENFVRLAFMLAAVLVASSCHLAQSDESGSVHAEEDLSLPQDEIPSIHMVMSWKEFKEGKNIGRDYYSHIIDSCKKAGWESRELSSDQVNRIGTGRVELFFDARAPFVREVVWSLGADMDAGVSPGVCRGVLEEKWSGGVDSRLKPGGGGIVPVEDTPDQVDNQRNLGWKFLGNAVVAGQPCKRWQNQYQEICMWSGGKRWGFSDDPVGFVGCDAFSAMEYMGGFPLERKLAGDKRQGCVSRVEKLTIGKGLLPETENPSGFGDEG